jgi:hypothetical protein
MTTMGAGHQHTQGNDGETEGDNNEGTATTTIAPRTTAAAFTTPSPHFAWEQGFFLFLFSVLIHIVACPPPLHSMCEGGITFIYI